MISIFLAFIILGVGYFLTSKISLLKKFSIPPSLTVSLIALVFFTAIPSYQQTQVYKDWKDWPGLIIAFIFAALFLESQPNSKKEQSSKEIIGEVSLIFIAILGQMLVGILLTYFLFKPFFQLPLAFASVLENGFAGGHGTAVAMSQPYSDNGLKEGVDYALFSATVGIVFGIAGGIFLVTKERKSRGGVVAEKEQRVTLGLSSLFISLGLIFTSVLVAILVKAQFEKFFPQLPQITLFVYALLVSVVLKNLLTLLKQDKIISGDDMSFFSSFFMELLIFSAISTMNLNVISNALIPLMILFTLGFIWNLFVHFKLKDKFFPKEYSTEISLINFGMLNGTTAIGLMLLRMIDPELKSKGVKVYAQSAPFTSPVVGGGILTLALPYLLTNNHPLLIALGLSIAMIVFYFVGKKK
ncbi:MAG: sodium/glutamate symporter [Leptospiraceae bacterium]|nr:sodium/glutamate symporter [Leptospiraceae bacterium]